MDESAVQQLLGVTALGDHDHSGLECRWVAPRTETVLEVKVLDRLSVEKATAQQQREVDQHARISRPGVSTVDPVPDVHDGGYLIDEGEQTYPDDAGGTVTGPRWRLDVRAGQLDVELVAFNFPLEAAQVPGALSKVVAEALEAVK